jgi:hypothetical protein
MQAYGRKALKDPMAAATEQIDKTYKDAIDIIRYGSVFISGRRYSELMDMGDGGGGDYERIMQSRELDGYSGSGVRIRTEKLKGRSLEAVYGGGGFGY